MDINPLSDVLAKRLSSLWVVFLFYRWFLLLWKVFLAWCTHLFIFSFVSLSWGDISDEILLWAMSKILLPMFSSIIFMVLGLTFKSWIYFEFILMCGVRGGLVSWFCMYLSNFPNTIYCKLSLAHCMCLLPLLNINWM